MENKFDFKNKSPWPEIRKERIRELLPRAMKCADIDLWIIICRKNANDPLAKHVGGENVEQKMAVVFQNQKNKIHSIAFSSYQDATELKRTGLYDELVKLENVDLLYEKVAKKIHTLNPNKIAINNSSLDVADGLSYTQRKKIEQALGFMKDNLVSSHDLLSQWLSIKLDQEIDILKKASALTNKIITDTYEKIKIGEMSYLNLEEIVLGDIESYGVSKLKLDIYDPTLNVGAENKQKINKDKIIQADSFVQINLGLKVYNNWCTNYQRYAYVLSNNDTEVPKEELKKWQKANASSRLVLANLEAGAMAYDIDLAQREEMHESGSEKVFAATANPIGYFLHDAGPYLTGGQREVPPTDALRILQKNQVFVYNGFFAWQVDGVKKLVSIKEMAVITDSGAKDLVDDPKELVLIKS